MGPRTASKTVIVGLAVVVLAVVAVAGLFGTSRTVEYAEEAFDPSSVTDIPVVVAKRESGGFEVLGLQFDAPDRWLTVAVEPPVACVHTAGEQETVTGGEGCETVESVAGPVQGGGVTADGDRWVELWVEVGAECYRAAAVGDHWPALPESCAEPHG